MPHEEHAVGDLVLADSAAEDDHAGFLAANRHVVEPADVGDNVDDERGFGFVCTEVSVGRKERKSDVQVWKYIMSPSEPSVRAGQKMGILFCSRTHR